MLFESLAYAMGAPQGGGSGGDMLVQFFPLILMIAVFWFLLIRPQRKRQQEHKLMLERLRRGETVVTSGGLVGRIVDIDGDMLTLDVGETKMRVGRAFISGYIDVKMPTPPKEKKSKPELKEGKAPKKAEKRPAADSAAREERKEGKKE